MIVELSDLSGIVANLLPNLGRKRKMDELKEMSRRVSPKGVGTLDNKCQRCDVEKEVKSIARPTLISRIDLSAT